MTWIVGVDIGGTFTDFFAFKPDSGDHFVHKTPSTPENLARGVVDGLQAMFKERRIDLHSVDRLEHGTTVATNALLQRRGGELSLITTQGFRDLLEIGRQTRPHNYSLQKDYPTPLVPRERRIELAERVLATGDVRRAPSEAEIREAVRAATVNGVEACAVCFLFSYVNPAHEQAVAKVLREVAPHVHVSLSSEVHPEFREYERLSTTVLNAYLQPVMASYLSSFQSEITAIIPGAAIGINQSSGGLMSIDRATRFPVRTALSGPAAGVVGAVHVARRASRPNFIAFDMGGTSTDVCLVRNYSTEISLDRSIAEFPVRQPVVDIHSVGAGGGSIAWFGSDGLLKVGPASAGSVPGPACYARGGTVPTVTDANLILGRLSTDGLLGGRMPLDVDAARRAVAPIATQLGYTTERVAQGIVDIVVSNMVRAVRLISVERGHDPRDFALMAFGGAGPLHAAAVARNLEIGEIIVPPTPGILCAQGLVVSDLKEEIVQTVRMRLEETSTVEIQTHFGPLAARAKSWFSIERIPREERFLRPQLEMRYVGQNYEIAVELLEQSADEALRLPSATALRETFHRLHEVKYGFCNPEDPIEVVTFRLAARGRLKGREERLTPEARSSRRPAPIGQRTIIFEDKTELPTPAYHRSALRPGDSLAGPAVIDQLDATTLLFPDDSLHVDEALNLVIALGRS